ncbi:hypothetical protein DIE18_04355 [Burkholderia sp. Bp9125]|nr:hypothetical protein DIE18_04355 [Burkholderia sp. Bp9125]
MSNHNHAFQLHLQQLGRRFEADCQAAESRIRQAHTMADVVRTAEVVAPVELRAMKNAFPGYRRLHGAAERRLETLLHEQLQAMKAATVDGADALFLQYRQHDWQALRGTYASLYQRGEHEARRLLHARREASPDS